LWSVSPSRREDVGDTLVELEAVNMPRFAYGIAKRSFSVDGGGILTPLPPNPLVLYESVAHALLRPGSDGLVKPATDVVCEGCAYAGAGGSTGTVTFRAGVFEKRVSVFGRRFIEWSAGRTPRIGPAEGFTVIPMSNANAYGGVDGRVECPLPASPLELQRQIGEFPGIYRRNPTGKGYLATDAPIVGVELPNFENPDDLLTAERLVSRPDEWWRQPLPWSLGWRDLGMFPRLLALGSAPWFPAPEDAALEEVRRGFMPAEYRTSPERLAEISWIQEASLGMWFTDLPFDTPISVAGMHPEGATMSFRFPRAPTFDFRLDGWHERIVARATNVVLFPAENRVDITYFARTTGLPRVFIPTVHKYIPLALAVEGGSTVEYVPPPTPHDALVASGLRKVG
jgi:hypothetical protein